MRVDGWAIFDTYRQLPVWLRALLGACLIAGGITLAWTSHQRYLVHQAEERRTGKQNHPLVDRNDRGAFGTGLILTIAGCVVLMTSGRSRAEQHGYRF